MMTLTPSQLREIIKAMQQQRILVVGDLMLDKFIYGSVSRISPEAPVPVVKVTHDAAYPGGAANVARNLSDFGIKVVVSGLLGTDDNGHELKSLLETAHISTEGILAVANAPTIVKNRIIARHQQICRVDRETIQSMDSDTLDRLRPKLEQLIPSIDAIIIEDYGKGFITQEWVRHLIERAAHHGRPVMVDPNPSHLMDWCGATVVKPNRQEAYAAAGVPYAEDDTSLNQVGKALLHKWQLPALLITLGEHGMILFEQEGQSVHIPTRAREVYDVSGAGDTVIAFFTAAVAAGVSLALAAELANQAAGVVVGKLGTATLTPEELVEGVARHE